MAKSPIAHNVIVASATPPGMSAIAVIRLSGQESIALTQKVFVGKNLLEQESHTLHLGLIKDGDEVIDEVVVSIFKAPHSFTCENSVEISCHASPYIQRKILELLIQNGAVSAFPGEFTQRAFLNGKNRNFSSVAHGICLDFTFLYFP